MTTPPEKIQYNPLQRTFRIPLVLPGTYAEVDLIDLLEAMNLSQKFSFRDLLTTADNLASSFQ